LNHGRRWRRGNSIDHFGGDQVSRENGRRDDQPLKAKRRLVSFLLLEDKECLPPRLIPVATVPEHGLTLPVESE
jgi:hypothetical protein